MNSQGLGRDRAAGMSRHVLREATATESQGGQRRDRAVPTAAFDGPNGGRADASPTLQRLQGRVKEPYSASSAGGRDAGPASGLSSIAIMQSAAQPISADAAPNT
jgi:hypothetical protein